MNYREDQSSHASKLCNECSKVDFESLFSSDLKAFWLGKLSAIMQNDNCPFCRLIVHAIHNKSPELGSSWKTADRSLIDVWIKTTFWARYEDGVREEESIRKSAKLRYRPALGISWKPEDRKNWDRAKCLTICEFDSILIKKHDYFPTSTHQDHSQVMLRRRLIPAELDLDLVRAWIDECQSQHHHPVDGLDLQKQLRATGQFRLYDVVQCRLVQPTNDVKYIALSYVWGDAFRMRQRTNPRGWWDNLFDEAEPCEFAEGGRRVRFSELPVVIQDASLLLRSLGWRFLRVDLLCVCQNNQSQKQLLIDRMHIVYKGASLTLVAAGGLDAESPLHGLRSGTRCPENPGIVPTTAGPISLVVARPELPELLRNTPWNSRGWTSQEDILSSCCLYFTQEEVFYSCDHHTPLYNWRTLHGFPKGRFSEWREGYVLESRYTLTAYQSLSPWDSAWHRSPSHGLRFATGAKLLDENTIPTTGVDAFKYRARVTPHLWDFYDYAFLVHKFSTRIFTNGGDKVNAFSGILGHFNVQQTSEGDVKLHDLLRAGPGIGSLAKALLWIPCQGTALRRRYNMSASGTGRSHMFPSWSWSGWVGEVEYPVERCSFGERDDKRWVFSPARFEPKQTSLRIKDIFKWTVQNNDRIVATLAEGSQSLDEAPRKRPADPHVCTLTLFTYVAETTLTQHRGFMSQDYQTWTDHAFYKMHHCDKGRMNTRGVSLGFLKTGGGKGILPDAGTLNSSGEYKLVCIGCDMRLSFPVSKAMNYVVLLIEKKGGSYERRGLSAVPRSSFQWRKQWIDIA